MKNINKKMNRSKLILPILLCISIFLLLGTKMRFAYVNSDSLQLATPTESALQIKTQDLDEDSLTWTREDFNIAPDGKTIGYRADVTIPENPLTGEHAHVANINISGLNERGKEKLKKNHHLVIPDGIEVISEVAFIGKKQDPPDCYIDELTLPQSLRVIEYGAFAYQKIKGTIVFPSNIISIHSAAFTGNMIEKVAFEGIIDDKGKLNEVDNKSYYLNGIGTDAFQGNKISEIDIKGDLKEYKFKADISTPSEAIFDNQQLGEFTIEVGEEYKRPFIIRKGEDIYRVMAIEGFKEDGTPVQLEQSTYFKKNEENKFVAIKTGKLEGQALLYDLYHGNYRIIGTIHFVYNIVPKIPVHTVTFIDDGQVYALVKVKKGKSIDDNSILEQIMPPKPNKSGLIFKEWNTLENGKGDTFNSSYIVNDNMKVYAIYAKESIQGNEPQAPKPETGNNTSGPSTTILVNKIPVRNLPKPVETGISVPDISQNELNNTTDNIPKRVNTGDISHIQKVPKTGVIDTSFILLNITIFSMMGIIFLKKNKLK